MRPAHGRKFPSRLPLARIMLSTNLVPRVAPRDWRTGRALRCEQGRSLLLNSNDFKTERSRDQPLFRSYIL